MAASSPLILVIMATIAIFGFMFAPPCAADNSLTSPNSLFSGQSLATGSYGLIMQKDCNMVLYDAGNPIYATNTGGLGFDCRLTLHNDGNLVIYDKGNRVIWETKTNGKYDHYVLVLQQDRNVVIYGPAVWATGTFVNDVGVPAGPHSAAPSVDAPRARTGPGVRRARSPPVWSTPHAGATPSPQTLIPPSLPALSDQIPPSLPGVSLSQDRGTPSPQTLIPPSLPALSDQIPPSLPGVSSSQDRATPSPQTLIPSSLHALSDQIPPSLPGISSSQDRATPSPQTLIPPSLPALSDQIPPSLPGLSSSQDRATQPSGPYLDAPVRKLIISAA